MPERDPLPEILPVGWQTVLRDAVRDIDELAALLDLPAGTLRSGRAASGSFPLLVPRGFIARMRPGDPNDPLLRQILPLAQEMEDVAGYCDDPLDERTFAHAGVIKKYPSRALLVTTAACPVHCRYCFRRSFPYANQNASRGDWIEAIDAVQGMPDITELILSGGDPLSLSDRRLRKLFARIAATDAIRTVRIHTRFPIMIPERVTETLTELIAGAAFGTVVVVHCNHAREIDAAVAAALGSLKPHCAALLNQSVLLRGVNDDTATLRALSQRLFDCGVLPYYLHALDRVSGTGHFAVDDATAIALIESLRASLPGYLVPRLVREVPGRLSKTPVVIDPTLL